MSSLPSPSTILCVGLNYRAHAQEAGLGQWTRGKSLDTFAALGPMTDADPQLDPQHLRIRCRVNGETVQYANTDEMIFSIDEIVAHATRGITLRPGDVIATGTPAGIGSRRVPARALRAGDVVEVDIESIGVLTNPVIDTGDRV